MIDAHHHCWQLGANGCTWPTSDLAPIYRDCGLPEFIALAQAAGITGSVLVQSQPCDADTDYLLQLADECDFIKAVVGWVDLAAAGAPARIAHLAQHPKLRGLRPMLQGLAEHDWILRPELEPALVAMQQHQLAFDALIFPRHLPYIEQLAERYPALAIVIDHAAKPALGSGTQPAADWCAAIQSIARWPNVACKISGLATEANAQQGAESLAPYIKHLLNSFGPARLMWGSDWPVLGLAPNKALASYENWLKLVQSCLVGYKSDEIESVFIGASSRFYRIA